MRWTARQAQEKVQFQKLLRQNLATLTLIQVQCIALSAGSFCRAEKLDTSAKVFVDNFDVTKEIRTPEVSKLASDVSKFGFVRKKLTDLQRKMAEVGKVIMDGRDIGTQVLPNADLKIFLTASLEERARRRFEELKLKNSNVELEKIQQEIFLRDKQDSEREIAPLKQADDAILLDTTNLSIDEVAEKILELANAN